VNEEEIKEYLKNNLSIEVENRASSGYNDNRYDVVKLLLNGNVISEDYIGL